MDVIARDGTHEGITTMSETIERTDVALVLQNPVAVLTDGAKFDALYASIKAEATAHQPDTATDKGRKAIAAMAFRITRTKTAIDAAGKQLNEEARARIGVVDAARREIRERLDALASDVRKPLTEWEGADKARKDRVSNATEALNLAAMVSPQMSSTDIEGSISEVSNFVISPALFGEDMKRITDLRDLIAESLRTHHTRAIKEEADRAELDRLRTEAAARAEADRLAKEAADAEAARDKEREAEAERTQAAAVLAAQTAAANKAAAEIAELERQRKADADKAEADRVAEQKRHADELAKIQRDRLVKEAADAAEAKRIADEATARANDRAHRGAVMTAAKTALMETAELDEETAKRVVMAITGGHVPAVSMRF
jgi:colicin import membrane protein